MRLLTFALVIAFVGAWPLNITDGIEPSEKEADWQLIPDADYKLHLVDINAVDYEIEPAFVGFDDVVFRLFTKSNPVTPQAIRILNDTQLQNSFFNTAHQTRFHIHGWTEGGPNTGNIFRDAYLNRGDFNVFAVDWGAGAQSHYVLSRKYVGEVGRVVAQFIDWLNLRGMAFSDVTVIGHSLGAHAAGHAGKAVTRGKLPVIVGIDPAGPLFSVGKPSDRVDITDATHVEGCEGDLGSCSHIIPVYFMAESINPDHIFEATRCRDYNDIKDRNCVASGPSRRMGGEPVFDGVSPPGSVYFLETNPTSPYSQGPIQHNSIQFNSLVNN